MSEVKKEGFATEISGSEVPVIDMPGPSRSQRMQEQFERERVEREAQRELVAADLAESIKQIVYLLNRKKERPIEGVVGNEQIELEGLSIEIDDVDIRDVRIQLTISQRTLEGGDKSSQDSVVEETVDIDISGRIPSEGVETMKRDKGFVEGEALQDLRWFQIGMRMSLSPDRIASYGRVDAMITSFEFGSTTIAIEGSPLQFTNHGSAPKLSETSLNGVLAKVIERLQTK
jgi:hypothetical protein